MSIVQYLEKSDNMESEEDLFTHLNKMLSSLGFDRFAFFLFLPRTDVIELRGVCPYNNFPEDLKHLYLFEMHYLYSPIFEKMKMNGKIIRWKEYSEKAVHSKQTEPYGYFKRMNEHGYTDGFSIPIFGPANSFGHLVISNDGGMPEVDNYKKTVLKHLGVDLLERYLCLTENNNEYNVRLSPREKEVLSWVLKGKSNSVIAQIMKISVHTVETHLKRSSKKLNTSSKSSSALTSVLMGLLHY